MSTFQLRPVPMGRMNRVYKTPEEMRRLFELVLPCGNDWAPIAEYLDKIGEYDYSDAQTLSSLERGELQLEQRITMDSESAPPVHAGECAGDTTEERPILQRFYGVDECKQQSSNEHGNIQPGDRESIGNDPCDEAKHSDGPR
jgi:hypothetical protein